ncbi:MAG: hypothetical protein JXR29_06680 [Methylothermaceae bacterium]|nr:hypothetical protein [Methylothermaceae bacterium]
MSAFDGGAAVNEPGRRHVLTRLSKAEISAEDRLIAWRKYCHHRIDMTAADWAALQGDTKPKEIEICRSDDIKK